MNSRRATMRNAFSMVEVVVSTLLVSVVLVAALEAVGASVRTWEAATAKQDARRLAQTLLDEILASSYEQPPLETLSPVDSTRSKFDNLNQYGGWSKSPPELRDGTQLTQFNNWTRSVTLTKLSADNPTTASSGSTDEGLTRITVTIENPAARYVDDRIVSLSAIRSRHGANEQSQGADLTVNTHVEFQIEVGTDPIDTNQPLWSTNESVELQNHATGP